MSLGPKLSVVVASQNAAASVVACLSALGRPDGVEILVVDNSTDGTTDIVRERFPEITLIVEPPSALIPELWGTGIRRSRGAVVAITTTHCVPAPDWVARMLEAHESPAPGIGGAIENDESGTITDWAVYFCRYSAYMPPAVRGVVEEIPGDNASYKREELDRYAECWLDGFFEPVFHAELRRAGQELMFDPSIVVTHKHSFGFWSFMRGRFLHGLQFGAWRASQLPAARRLVYLVLYPAIPFVLLLRIVRQVVVKRRHRGRLLAALPILFAFLTAWATGEMVGALRGRPA